MIDLLPLITWILVFLVDFIADKIVFDSHANNDRSSIYQLQILNYDIGDVTCEAFIAGHDQIKVFDQQATCEASVKDLVEQRDVQRRSKLMMSKNSSDYIL